jgi:hypothetical protein
MVVSFLAKEGFFDHELYEKYHILTSRGIQKRYFEIVKRRDKVVVIKQFLLLDNLCIHDVCNNHIYVDINTIDVNRNALDVNILAIDVTKGSKVKESIESKAKHRESTTVETPPIKKLPLQKTKQISKQLAAAAKMLRNEDTAEYKKLLELHPELEAEETPWDVTPTGER